MIAKTMDKLTENTILPVSHLDRKVITFEDKEMA
jgi:hypothetical protein